MKGVGITDRGSTFGGITSSLAYDASQGREFLAGLKKLERMGLSKSLLSQIAQQGPGSLGTVNALLGSGRAGVGEANRL